MTPLPANKFPNHLPTLVDIAQYFAASKPDHPAYTFLLDGEVDEIVMGYQETDRRARAIAAWLQERGLAGERALLLYPSGLDYIAAFYGCLYAGVVAVPVYPPRLNRPSSRIHTIVADAQAQLVLTTGHVFHKLERRFEHMPDLAALHWLNTDDLPSGLEDRWQRPFFTPDTLAFLQYTSGSTSSPKGVMVSHGNLMHNLELINQGFETTRVMGEHPNGRGLFWLPMYHDMGLIGGILQPMYTGTTATYLDPAAFLQRPLRWLSAISRYHGIISGAPNFAFDLCVDKTTPEQRAKLDLSHWQIAFCGAEPIRADTLDRFAKAFAPAGFRHQAFYPCYGLAESTLMVTGGHQPEPPIYFTVCQKGLARNRVEPATDAEDCLPHTLISSGQPLGGQTLLIVNPDTHQPVPANEVGEIWLAGSSITQGYWGRPDDTKASYGAHLADDPQQQPFFRTGDLGFLYQNELFVTGRLKDLIIIRGRNHYPQDIEHTVESSHPAIQPHMGAAFSVPVAGEEQLVVAYELQRAHRHADPDPILTAVHRAITQTHGIQPYAVLLLKPLTIPKTSSGKIQRRACCQAFLNETFTILAAWTNDGVVAPPVTAVALSNDPSPTTAVAIIDWLTKRLAIKLGLPLPAIDTERPLAEYGLDSAQLLGLVGELESWLGYHLPPTLLWDFPTIGQLAAHLAGTETAVSPTATPQTTSEGAIAVIGLGCRFPGAASPAAFWELLQTGHDAIETVPADRWDMDAFYQPKTAVSNNTTPLTPGKMNTRWGGFLPDVARFDASFFGITPREAVRMDPQQRLVLEVAWETLENAALSPSQLAGKQGGVFMGASSYDYAHGQWAQPEDVDAYVGTGNAHSIVANRLSYLLDWHGPSLAVDTACSSSLVAIHLAMRSLRSGECDIALAGGVNLILLPEVTVAFAQARMMAADGRCKTFDARADGYVRSEGVGLVALKRLEDAERDGDQIVALLCGSAINQDGRSNGLTAPNGRAQTAVIYQALADARVTPHDLDYIEAHGTGTRLGDPIEINALQSVLDVAPLDVAPLDVAPLDVAPIDVAPIEDAHPCYVGSVKTNIGHLEAAAGIAGLLKVILALQHEKIPPHLHLQSLNPHLNLSHSRVAIPTQAQTWPRSPRPRLAGVSSFGFGGTNAHIIVAESPPQPANRQPGRPDTPLIFPLSAQDQPALQRLAQRYAGYLQQHPTTGLADLCHTMQQGRDHLHHRLAIITAETNTLQTQLAAYAANESTDSLVKGQVGQRPKIAFLFTGQGAQYLQMGQDLYDQYPIFRDTMNHCDEIVRPYLERPLLSIIYPTAPDKEAEQLIHQTAYTQPALFALEYALVALWQAWGVEPDIVMGHSLGEDVAACVAGVFSLEDGLRMVCQRGALMQSLPEAGTMAAIFAGQDQVLAAIAPYADRVSLAAVNGPHHTVISGAETAVQTILAHLTAAGVTGRLLTVSHAFHSPLMEPMLAPFAQAVEQISYQSPRLPLVSNLSGQVETAALVNAQHWVDHVRQPVRFKDGIEALAAAGVTAFIEIGPQPHLLGMARRSLTHPPQTLWLPSLKKKSRAAWPTFLESAAILYTAGASLCWPETGGNKLALPTYPFGGEQYWWSSNNGSSRTKTAGNRQTSTAVSKPENVGDLPGKRLATALPTFETWLDEQNWEAIYQQLAVTAAEAAGDKATYRVQSWQINSRPEQDSPVRFQTILNPHTDDETITTQLFYQIHDRWQLAAQATLQADVPPPPLNRTRLLAVAERERPLLLETYLQEQLAQIMHLMPAEIDRHQSLDRLGLDSLMAIELRHLLETNLGAPVALGYLLSGPTTAQLATKLAPAITQKSTTPDTSLQSSAFSFQPVPTVGQQAMWFLHQVVAEGVAFNVAGAVRVANGLNVAALHQAWQQIMARHEGLRTTFSLVDGRLHYHIQPHLPLPFTEVDAIDWDDDRLQAYLEQAAHQPFNLEKGPLFRFLCLQRQDEMILLLAVSHMVCDFWSVSILVEELTSLYLAYVAKRPLSLPPLTYQYTDYAHRQAEMLAGPEGQRLATYWQQQLAGKLPLLDLPTDHPRPPAQSFSGSSVLCELDETLTAQLHALSQAQGATLYVTLLAAFQLLLYRYTGQDDLLVGSVLAGRDQAKWARVIGYFINPVAIRTRFAPQMSFEAYLGQVRQTTLAAMDHQAYPLPLLADHLDMVRDPGRPPLFETMFIFQKAPTNTAFSLFALGIPGASVTLESLTLEAMPLGGLPAQFDLTLMMAEGEKRIAAALYYSTALFTAATAERLLTHLQALLASIVAAPHAPLLTLPFLPDAERQQQLVTWNETISPYPRQLTLPELIEKQLVDRATAVALTVADRDITYATLQTEANRLAHYLQSLGVGPETLVGICLPRTAEMVIGLLAVLKAGGAYVPLDPDFPTARLALMLDDAQPSVLLTVSQLAPSLPAVDCPLICLDKLDEVLAQQPDTTPLSHLTADNLAYVIYTSGSTGRPKGVQIPHRAVVNFLLTMAEKPGLTAADGLLAVTTLSFDIAVLELFLPLVTGARLILVDRETAVDGVALGAAINQSGATVMQATPSTWHMLLKTGWQNDSLRQILCGGEALSRDLATQLQAQGARVWNMYGPTETTVWSTRHEVTDEDGIVPIGRPIANTQIYILDKTRQPLPIGVVGDLYIGGDGLARGYLNQPDLTAERFIHYKKEAADSRQAAAITLYKTGDLARYRSDGTIIFLGRDDHQVKIRGYRIELDEVAVTLRQHEAVEHCVVVSQQSAAAHAYLAAYLVWQDGQKATTADLRHFLEARLPEYMIPAVFVPLNALPLTPNGKVDRQALPAAPLAVGSEGERPFIPPRTPLEIEVAHLFAQVLELEQVGIHDSFLDLGGNSLLASQLIYQLQQTLQVTLPLRHLFAHPTVAGVSQLVQMVPQTGGNGVLSTDVISTITVEQLAAEARLPESIRADNLPAYRPEDTPQHILLTGATGFLGAYLLHDLLQQTTAKIYCLVRSENVEAGFNRLRHNLEFYGLWDNSQTERLEVIVGNLAQPALGLTAESYQRLAETIDLIYHNGALVNFIYPYQWHKATNVSSTITLLQLATTAKLKPLHLVSTLSIFHNGQHDTGVVFYENQDLLTLGVPFGGYAQSKWVAEKLTLTARERGVPVTIYRPGVISGHSQTGQWNANDMMATMVRLSTTIGAVPDLDRGKGTALVDVVPVDYVSQAIIHLSQQADSRGKVFHLANPHPMPYQEVIAQIRAEGVAVELRPFGQWRNDLAQLAGNGQHNPFLPLLSEVTVEQIFMPAFDCRQTTTALQNSGITCPPLDKSLLQTYLAYFKAEGIMVKT